MTRPTMSGETAGSEQRLVVSSSAAPAPAGTYSPAILAGGLLHLAGQTPRRPDGSRLVDESFEVQVRQTLDNAAALAAAGGTALSEAVSCTVYLARISDRAEFDEIWREYVGAVPPARTLVQCELGGFAVEVTFVLACPPHL